MGIFFTWQQNFERIIYYLLLHMTAHNVHSNKTTLKTTILLTHTFKRQFYGHDKFDAQFDTLRSAIMQYIEVKRIVQL